MARTNGNIKGRTIVVRQRSKRVGDRIRRNPAATVNTLELAMAAASTAWHWTQIYDTAELYLELMADYRIGGFVAYDCRAITARLLTIKDRALPRSMPKYEPGEMKPRPRKK